MAALIGRGSHPQDDVSAFLDEYSHLSFLADQPFLVALNSFNFRISHLADLQS